MADDDRDSGAVSRAAGGMITKPLRAWTRELADVFTRARVSATLLAVSIACCLVLALAGGVTAADRDARAVTPRGSPVWLDPLRALLFDSPSVLVILENQHSQPVSTALRVWIFDPDLRLKASVDYCAIEQLDRRTRGSVLVPLEVSGITLRDRAVVTVARAGSAAATCTSIWPGPRRSRRAATRTRSPAR